MAIVETTKNVTYSGSNRIATIEQTITRADDCEKLGSLYYRLSDMYRRLGQEIPADERTALEADRVKILSEIETYTEYLNGYTG